MHPSRLLLGFVLLAWGGLEPIFAHSQAAARGAGPPLAARVVADSLLLARAMQGQRVDSLIEILDRDVATARRRGDRGPLVRLLRLRGVGHALASRPAAIPDLDEALRLSEALGDSTLMMASLRWRAYMAGVQERFDEQERLARRLLGLAEAAADARMQAVAQNFIGWIARQRGDYRAALSHLEAAARAHRRSGNETEEAVVLTALGSVQIRLGDYSGARATCGRQLEIARRLGNRWLEAQAQTGLGTIESLVGDPIRALDAHRSAWEIQRSFGETVDAAKALAALIHSQHQAGRLEDAIVLGREAVAMCERRGFHSTRSAFLAQMGWIETDLDHPDAADRAWRRVLAMGDSADVESRVSAVQGLARRLGYANRPEEMRELLRARLPDLLPRCSSRSRLELQAALIQALGSGHRWQEALGLAEKWGAAAESLEANGIAMWIWRWAGTSNSALGRPERAQAAFERGIRNWEAWRREASHADWQERRTRMAIPLAQAYADFLASRSGVADSVRVAAAFDLIQRFKSRTLRERLSRSEATRRVGADRPITSGGLRADVLRPGELLLEWFAGENSTLLFAVSRREHRLIRFPNAEIRDPIKVARGLLERPPQHDTDFRGAAVATRELGHALLARVSDMVAGARTVIFAPDDLLHGIPFAALEIPGSRVHGALGEERSVVVVPSATVFAEVRSRRRPGSGRGLLAVSPGGRSSGRPTEAAEEVEWLAADFEEVTRIATQAGRPLAPTDLAGFGALHFAGHSAVDERFPWRSAIATSAAVKVGARAPDDSLGAALRAEAIVSSRLDARLAVLASCQTVGAQAARGEGVAGLASAFLAAGVPTVIATLWPVDDLATERLMREFYTHLGRGETAAHALRAAQARLRGQRVTRHPWYWAGFVLVGEGETTLPLRPRALSREGLLRRLAPGRP